MQDSTPVTAVPLLLAVVVAGTAVALVLQRLRPKMPLTRRMLWVVGGGLVIGGAFYGATFGR